MNDQMRELFGANLFDENDWAKSGIILTPAEIPPFRDGMFKFLTGPCPWTKKKLAYETHSIFLVPSHLSNTKLCLESIRDKFSRLPEFASWPKFNFKQLNCYGDLTTFHSGFISSEWLIMPLKTVSAFSGLKFPDQYMTCMSSGYETGEAFEECMKLFLFYLKNGKFPDENNSNRCIDNVGEGNPRRISVGARGKEISAGTYWDGDAYPDIRLSLKRIRFGDRHEGRNSLPEAPILDGVTCGAPY